jgi:hypothetical protein
MKHTYTLIFCLFTLLAFSQNAVAQTSIDTASKEAQLVRSYTSDGVYFNGKLYAYGRQTKTLFATEGNKAAAEYYQQFQRNNFWGMLTNYVGSAVTFYSIIQLITGGIPRGVSAGTLVGGFGIWLGGSALVNKSEKKYQKAVSEFNAVQQKRQATSLQVGAQPHGLGLALRF